MKPKHRFKIFALMVVAVMMFAMPTFADNVPVTVDTSQPMVALTECNPIDVQQVNTGITTALVSLNNNWTQSAATFNQANQQVNNNATMPATSEQIANTTNFLDIGFTEVNGLTINGARMHIATSTTDSFSNGFTDVQTVDNADTSGAASTSFSSGFNNFSFNGADTFNGAMNEDVAQMATVPKQIELQVTVGTTRF